MSSTNAHTTPIARPAAAASAPAAAAPVATPPAGVDPRGQRVAAGLTALVLAAVLLTASTALLALQAVVFAVAVALGVRRSPYAYAYSRLIRPRIAAPPALEDPRPPRFAQAVGLGFAVAGLVGYIAGAPTLGAVATGLALVAALLNAAFGLCLGCELYLLLARLRGRPTLPT